MSASIPLQRLIVLFAILLGAGIGLTLPLFHFNYRKFVRSSLCVKILFWIPIFIIFIGVLYASNPLRLALLALLLAAAGVEFFAVIRKGRSEPVLFAYYLLFALGLAHFYLLETGYPAHFTDILVTLCFSTVLSDVAAFFFGNYLGRHKLPDWLNGRKSWEGVAGQVAGAFIGVLLVNAFVLPVATLWLFVPLGLGSAMGDLANSFAKRRAAVKDWSGAIPGHGGFIDRLSSMAGSAALTFYFLKISGVL